MDDWILQSNAYVLTYMINDYESFKKIEELILRVKNIKRTTKIPMILAGKFLPHPGNKKDKDGREVTEADARVFADKLGIKFLETSAKSGENIQVLAVA